MFTVWSEGEKHTIMSNYWSVDGNGLRFYHDKTHTTAKAWFIKWSYFIKE